MQHIEEAITAQVSSESDENIAKIKATEGVVQESNRTKNIQDNNLAVWNIEIESFEMTEKQDLLNPVSNVPLSIQKQDFEIVTASIGFDPSFELIPTADMDIDLSHESGFKKAYQYAKRVKNGEEPLFDLRKAKDDLFAMAKNIKLNNQSKPN